jgi:hypothetical protein
MGQLYPQQYGARLRPAKRLVESLSVFPGVCHQDRTPTLAQFVLDTLDKSAAHAFASCRLCHQKRAEIRAEAEVVCTSETEKLPGFFPNVSKTVRCGKTPLDDVVAP